MYKIHFRRPVPSLQSSSQPPAPSQQPATQSRSGLSNVSNISSSSPARPLSAPGPVSTQPQKTPSGTAPVPIIPQPRPPGLGGGRSAPGPPLPRPVLPRDRGYMDKFVEFLVSNFIEVKVLLCAIAIGFRGQKVQL